MKSNQIDYDVSESAKRIEEIISESDLSFEELDSIPAREKLTFTNGFYVKCSALFVDIPWWLPRADPGESRDFPWPGMRGKNR